jgi:signal transduction histidine kinase
MNEDGKPVTIEPVAVSDIAEALGRTRIFAEVDPATALSGPVHLERVQAKAGAVLVVPEEPWEYYWVLLDGETHAERKEADGSWSLVGRARTGEGFGEVALLAGKKISPFRVTATRDSQLVRFDEQGFWNMMSCCVAARGVILRDMAQRMQSHQVEALHKEKLVSLGVMAAGLMHELHNPGTAARRASTQMRENLLRLQRLSLRGAAEPPRSPEQQECLRQLMERTFSSCKLTAMGSVEQADAEEALAGWLKDAEVENAYSLAPALVAAGLNKEELACARAGFQERSFSDALNWLESLVSNVALVCTIEESIGRMSDLVMAVKKFAYEDRAGGKELDVHDSLQSTLTILGYKLRVKSLTVDKHFEASPAKVVVRGPALSQVWTNLVDNAIDASPPGTTIRIATWNEADVLGVSVEDQGSGIPLEVLPHIFEPFFTTKPQGAGTGLGLEIAHRIVTQNLGGTIEVKSEPGKTRFLVRLPINLSPPVPNPPASSA